WHNRPVRLIMITTLFHGLYSIWGFYATQPYFLDLLGQPDAVWVSGVVAALVSLTGIIGGWLVARFMRRFRFRTTILIATAAVYTAATIGVGLASSFWLAVGLFLLGSLVVSIFTPVKQSYIHQIIPSAQRATVISFDSMMSSAGGVVGQTGLGYLSREQGLATGFVAGGIATMLALPFLVALRGTGEKADQIKSNQELPPTPLPVQGIAEDGSPLP
ncbi:MAG TPA: MFS transporter, partial [Oceanobacillus sp.]|nr:MFS transporter [Oceanobacillus sp.]